MQAQAPWIGLLNSEAPADGGDPGAGGGGGDEPAPPADGGGGEGQEPTAFTLDQVRSMKPVDLLTDEQLKADPTLGNISDFETMARMLQASQKMVGNPKNYLKRLSPEATPEERQAFYRELGAPEKPDEYGLPELERPEGMPEMSQERLNQFREVFHGAGLNKEQSDAILAAYSQLEVEVWQGATEQSQQLYEQAQQQLKEDWGQAYDQKLQEAQLVADKKGDDFKAWLERNNLDNDPHMIRLLAELGGNLQDPSLPAGGRPGVGGAMTPSQALERIAELRADQGFVNRWTNEHAQGHKEAVDEMTRLYNVAYPTKASS